MIIIRTRPTFLLGHLKRKVIMSTIFVNSSAEATKGDGWSRNPDFKSNETIVTKAGVSYEVLSQETKKTSLIKRIGVIALTILTLGTILFSSTCRNIALHGKEVVEFAVMSTALKAERKKEEDLKKAPATLKDRAISLKNDAVAIKDRAVSYCKKNQSTLVKAGVAVAVISAVGLLAYYLYPVTKIVKEKIASPNFSPLRPLNEFIPTQKEILFAKSQQASSGYARIAAQKLFANAEAVVATSFVPNTPPIDFVPVTYAFSELKREATTVAQQVAEKTGSVARQVAEETANVFNLVTCNIVPNAATKGGEVAGIVRENAFYYGSAGIKKVGEFAGSVKENAFYYGPIGVEGIKSLARSARRVDLKANAVINAGCKYVMESGSNLISGGFAVTKAFASFYWGVGCSGISALKTGAEAVGSSLAENAVYAGTALKTGTVAVGGSLAENAVYAGTALKAGAEAVGGSLAENAVYAGTALKTGAEVVGSSLAENAVYAGTALKAGAEAVGSSIAENAVYYGTPVITKGGKFVGDIAANPASVPEAIGNFGSSVITGIGSRINSVYEFAMNKLVTAVTRNGL